MSEDEIADVGGSPPQSVREVQRVAATGLLSHHNHCRNLYKCIDILRT